MGKNLVIAIYSHPEYYPPTLNAIENLAPIYDMIYIVHRNVIGFDWKYPVNVQLVAPAVLMSPREVEKASLPKKIAWFLHFTWLFFSTARNKKADAILMCDAMPLLSFRLFYLFIKLPRILWYHNHDVTDLRYIKKQSLSWWAWKSEKWIFPRLDLFTLPAVERKQCFDMKALKGVFMFIPNYPSVKIYEAWQFVKKSRDPVCLLYQGSIGPKHGLEEIIPLLNSNPGGVELLLVLKGFISSEYLFQLQELAQNHGVENKLIYKGPGGYRGVIENAAGCHIGIGIHKNDDMMNKTLGTASNKIYEYAALGLPVLLYDNTHFRQHLGNYEWTFFTDCSAASLQCCLETIINKYGLLSEEARADFNGELNFEHYFKAVMDFLNTGWKRSDA